MRIAYNGSNYCGWQRQTKDPSVQQTLEEALSTVLNTPIKITGCGRTDTGVHARNYYLHFDTDVTLPGRLIDRLNKYLPVDIAVYTLKEMPVECHARFDATSRTYQYLVSLKKNPLMQRLAAQHPLPILNIKAMKDAVKLLPLNKNYYAFCKSRETYDHHDCEVSNANLSYNADNQLIIFDITANRFLHSMVRKIMGSLLLLGREKITFKDFEHALTQQELLKIVKLAEPQGLYLMEVTYPYAVE